MKKLLLLLAILLTTGCSLVKDNLEDAKINTTVYPIQYLTEKLYGNYSTSQSIYPIGADITNYELTEKQIKNYAKSDLFIYNGLSNEKNIAKNLINQNKNLLIIDVSYGLNYTHGMEELWMSPNNYLMLAKNIKDNLIEYLKSKYIIQEVEKNYEQLAESLSLMDADLRAIGKDAKTKGKNTLIVNDNLFKYLENYGFNIISLDPETVTDTTLENTKNAFKKKTYDTLIILDDNISDEIDSIITEYKAKTIEVSSMLYKAEEDDDYVAQMQAFIDSIRNLSLK